MRLSPKITGLVTAYAIKDAVNTKLFTTKNFSTFSGMDLIVSLLSGKETPINGIYLEYANGIVAESIVIPEINPQMGLQYYKELTGDKDYIRMPANVKGNPSASSALYTGNRITFHGAGDFTEGVNGTPYGYEHGSIVYGVALAYLGPTPEHDIIFSRSYFAPEDRIPKAEKTQIGIDWTTTIYHPSDTEE